MATETIFLSQPVQQNRGRTIAAPFQFMVTGEDHLRVRSFCSVAGVALSVDQRFALIDGGIQASSDIHSPASDRTAVTSDIRLAPGYVLNLVIRVRTGTVYVGQCYVIVDVIRGTGAAAIVLGQMLGGYVSTAQGLAWPGSPITSSVEGPGYPTDYAAGTPGTGFSYAYTVPAGVRWELVAYRIQVTTVATVGNRPIVLYMKNSSGVNVAVLPMSAEMPPSTANELTWGQGLPAFASVAQAVYLAPLPYGIVLTPAATFTVVNNNHKAGDLWASPTPTVKEWLEAA